MTGARREIIESIRKNLAASRRFDSLHAEHGASHAEVDLASAGRANFSQDDVVENFRENLELIGAKSVIAKNAAEAAAAANTVIERLGAERIAVSNSDIVAETVATIDNVKFTRAPSKEFLFDSELGITSAQWAIAETGTLVLEAESEDHRLISLVPPVHVCLIEASRIRQTLGEILELTRDGLGHAITFVTGASRTSDIELTLAIGVHGPGELHVIILGDQ